MRLILFLSFFLTLCPVFAQSAKIVSAFDYLKTGELNKAKESIEEAVLHKETSSSAKAWYCKGVVYFEIFSTKEVKYFDEHAIDKMLSSFTRARELKKWEKYEDDMNVKLMTVHSVLMELGINAYNTQKHEEALKEFSMAVATSANMGLIDSIGVYNGALASLQTGEIDGIVDWFYKCAAIGYRTLLCTEVIKYLKVKKSEPNSRDQNLIIADINNAMIAENFEEVRINTELALQNDPTNKLLYYSLGVAHQYLLNYSEAEHNYRIAIEIDPNYFDALYNLGALLFNRGVEKVNSCNRETNPDLYMILQKEAKNLFNSAVGPLEKARDINPKDPNVLISLEQVYLQTGNVEKHKEVKEVLNKVNNGN